MIGTLKLGDAVYAVRSVEMHVPEEGETRWLYLLVAAEPDEGFALWGLELPLLNSLEALHGQRLHVRWGGDAFDDDTLGTDIIGVESTTDLNYWHGSQGSYAFAEVQVDFERVAEHRFRCCVSLLLTDPDADQEAGCVPQVPPVRATGEFTAEVDEIDPTRE
jgi:hypothetical protein